MDLFNKVHILGLMKSHIYETNISLISVFSLMLNYAKPRLLEMLLIKRLYDWNLNAETFMARVPNKQNVQVLPKSHENCQAIYYQLHSVPHNSKF